jgi:hypothetical protein
MLTVTQVPAEAPPASATPKQNSPVVATTVRDQGLDVATLQSQVRELQIELTGLQAQWDGLYSQLNAMLKNNPARPGVQQQWADVGVRIAQVKGEIAYREARIAQKQGLPMGTTTTPRGSFMRSIDPDIAVPMSALLLVVLGLPVSIAWAKRIMRGKPQVATPLPPDFNSRLENIERAIDTVAIEVERISEGQRFVTKILAQRPMDAGAGESSAEPPFVAPAPKALGAGPMEPITVPQRERVRQPIITPR